MQPIIHVTADNSRTLYIPELDEHYHSTFGALSESLHVYVECGLMHRAASLQGRRLRIFELGLGTGLNALLCAKTAVPIDYTAIEKFPVDFELVENLDYATGEDKDILKEIHLCEWGKPVDLTPGFMLHKIEGDFLYYVPSSTFDVIFMDAFAPDKQPELWNSDVLAKLEDMLAPGGVLTTYCAKGAIRRGFEQLGLSAERLPGPAGGKREILRVTKNKKW